MAIKSPRPFWSTCVALSISAFASASASAQIFETTPHTGATSTVVFSGIDFSKDSYAGWTGLIVSLERDLGKSGFMFRAVGVHAGYEYDTTFGTTPAVIDGDAWIGDVMIGYQAVHPALRAAAYIGIEYQDHDLTPDDPSNRVNGDEAGFKVVGELESPWDSRFYFGAIGAYSTAYDTYWTRGRLGLRHDGLLFGVEGGASGNDGYDNQRLGGFFEFPVPMGPLTGYVALHGGYQFADEGEAGLGGGRGAYGGVGYSFSF